uniref:OTU domain-containing protein n=1 Tax=Clytia hemisphaerica TaxID=252671 RepID=A0A7M5XM26_9CNID
IEVPGDGHCIFYSWEISLTASSTSKFKPTYTSLLDLVRMEFLTNQDNYKPFFFGQKDYNDEIKQTLDNKSYANCISDMMANALSNTTKTTAVVWEKENGQLVQRNVIIPALDANPVNGIIHLHKEGQHFEPIVKRQQKEISDALSSTHGLSLQQTQALSS